MSASNQASQLGNMERQLQQRDDEELFKQPPKADDCPICLEMLPTLLSTGTRFMTCCSKTICSGCAYVCKRKGYDVVCPHCKVELPKSLAGIIQQLTKRVEANNADAMYALGIMYQEGKNGVEQDRFKGTKLLLRASKLGSVKANDALVRTCTSQDFNKGVHYSELAAKSGCPSSRFFLGNLDALRGKMDRAIKHWQFACEGGNPAALTSILRCVKKGTATWADYRKALQSYQQYLKDVKTAERDEAAAHSHTFRYLLDADEFDDVMVV
jgi:hypothetical protein